MCDTYMMQSWREMGAVWVSGARPRTLPAAIVPVLVGVAAARGVSNGDDRWWAGVAALIVSLALQVGVNYANDYSDGIRGVDTDRIGPARLVGSGLVDPIAVRTAAFVAFGVAGASGAALAAVVSWWLIPVGVASVAAGWAYTGGPRPYGYMGLGEVVVFIFFGVVATCGTQFVVAGVITRTGLCASVVVGLFAVALLMINNLRDIPGDRISGKMTLAVRLGDTATRRAYVGVLLGAFVVVILMGAIDRGAWLALGAAPFALQPIRSVLRGEVGKGLIAVLGSTARVQMVAGVLLAVGLML